MCHEHGVKVGPWRLQHVVSEWSFGEHPTYGAISIGHWVCKDGQPWKVGVGLFLGRGPAKPKDLGTKLSAFDAEPPVIDHLILLRPEDDLALSGKSKMLWQEAERRGRHARLEAVNLGSFAILYGLPRWLAALTESLPAGQPPPNLGDLIQEHGDYLFAGLVFLSLLVIGGKFARRRLSTSGGDSAFGPRCFCLSLVDLFSPNSRSLTVGSITDGN